MLTADETLNSPPAWDEGRSRHTPRQARESRVVFLLSKSLERIFLSFSRINTGFQHSNSSSSRNYPNQARKNS